MAVLCVVLATACCHGRGHSRDTEDVNTEAATPVGCYGGAGEHVAAYKTYYELHVCAVHVSSDGNALLCRSEVAIAPWLANS